MHESAVLRAGTVAVPTLLPWVEGRKESSLPSRMPSLPLPASSASGAPDLPLLPPARGSSLADPCWGRTV